MLGAYHLCNKTLYFPISWRYVRSRYARAADDGVPRSCIRPASGQTDTNAVHAETAHPERDSTMPNQSTSILLFDAAEMLLLDAREWRERGPDARHGKNSQIKIAEYNEGLARQLQARAQALALDEAATDRA